MITLTEAAAAKVKELLVQRGTPRHGVRLGVRGAGCSGTAYFMEFCEAETQGDEVFESRGVKLVVDLRSALLLGGTEVDFVEGLMGNGFKFDNPNLRGSCGRGESFST